MNNTVDKQPANIKPQQPFIPRNPIVYKYAIPEKKPTDEIINKMFLVVTDGNFLKIKEFLLNNQMSMISKNLNGESVLHLIIKNSNITDSEKLQLVQLAIEKGAQVSSFDINNVTPLHLAAKLQLVNIVKLLLNFGAPINVMDNQYKTPLHYAVVGESAVCPDINKNKIKPLIPAKYDKQEKDTLVTKLYDSINEFLFTDEETKKYVVHIESTMKQFYNMFPYEIDEILRKNKQTIVDLLLDSSFNEDDKKKVIFEKITSTKNSMNEFVQKRISESIDQLQIKSNTYDGWGPDSLQQNRVLPNRTIMELAKFIDTNIQKEKGEIITKLQGSVGRLISDIQIVHNFSSLLNNVLGHCQIYGAIIGGQLNNAMYAELPQIFFKNGVVNPLLIPDLDMPYTYDPVNDVIVGPNAQINIKTRRANNPRRIRITKEADAMLYENQNTHAVPIYLSTENPMVVGPNFTQQDIANIQQHVIQPPLLEHGANPNTGGLYFNNHFNLYVHQLRSNLIHINNYISELEQSLDNGTFYGIYNDYIGKITIKILNIGLLLTYVIGEIKVIDKHVTLLKQYFERYGSQLGEQFQFLPEQIIDSLDKILTGTGKLEVQCDNIYQSSKKIYDILNSVISLIEMMSAQTCIEAFFKQGEFGVFYVNQNTNNIVNSFDKPLKKLRELSSTLEEFTTFRTTDLLQTKKVLIEEFLQQITILNSPSYISHAGGAAKPQIGYLLQGAPLNALLVNPITHDQKVLKLIEINKSPLVDDADIATLVGKIGTMVSTQYNKRHVLPLVVGKFLGTHLMMVKESIVRWVLQKVFNYVTNVEVPTFNAGIKLTQTLNELIQKFNEAISIDAGNYGSVLTLVGRYVDKILINAISGFGTNQTNLLLLKSLEQTNVAKHYTELPHAVLNSDGIIVPSQDNGFSLKLDEIFDELFSLYENSANINNPHLNWMSIGNIGDDQTKDTKIHKIVNFNYDVNSLDQICFKIDQDVILLLLKNNANVNAKDNLGNSPIYYAIEMKNMDILQILLESGAIVNGNLFKNKQNKSPLNYAWDEYISVMQQYIINKYEICEKITKKLIDTFKKKIQYGNNVPKHSKMLLPMLLYMLDHQFYLIGKGYPNNWSYEANKQFEQTINLQILSALPLLNIQFTDTEFASLELPNAFIEQLNTQIKTNDIELKSLENKKENLMKELKELTDKQIKTEHDNLRIEEINNTIQNDVVRMTFLVDNTRSHTNKLHNISVAKVNPLKGLETFIALNKNKFKNANAVNKIYDSVFINVLNSDYVVHLNKNKYVFQVDTKTYPLLWKKYFSSMEQTDHTQIIDRIADYQKRVIVNDSISVDQKIKDFSIVSDYLSNAVLPFCKNYFELPKEYNGANYSLTIVLDIITHIVKRIIMVNLMDTIVKSLTKYVLSVFPKNDGYKTDGEYQNYIINILIQIIDDKGDSNGSRLLKYVYDILPLKIVKVILQIYEGLNEGETDIDRTSTIESLFSNINKIIGSSTALDIQDNSSLLANLKDYVYPFYGDYIELFIKEMKSVTDNYLRFLQSQSNALNLLNVLSQKV